MSESRRIVELEAEVAGLRAENASLRASLSGLAPKVSDRPKDCGRHGMDLECVGCGVRLYGADWPACCQHKDRPELKAVVRNGTVMRYRPPRPPQMVRFRVELRDEQGNLGTPYTLKEARENARKISRGGPCGGNVWIYDAVTADWVETHYTDGTVRRATET